MDKFIEKMEYLFENNRNTFIMIMIVLTFIGLFLIFPNIFYIYLPQEMSLVYVKSGGWLLLTSGILWLIYLGDQSERKERDDDLDEFLKTLKKGDTFTRHDFVEFLYGEKIPSGDNRYKSQGRTLRNAVGNKKIEVLEGREKGKLLYKKVG